MQRLEVSGAVRPLLVSLGVKGVKKISTNFTTNQEPKLMFFLSVTLLIKI